MMIAPVSEVSSCDYIDHLDINSVWKALVASYVCVAEARTHVFNVLASSAESVFRPQYTTGSLLALNMFVCSVIRI